MSKVERHDQEHNSQATSLRRGWTTGACATAATKSALTALLTGEFSDPVQITLPKGDMPQFPLTYEYIGEDWAEAGIVKDAGDDPDVTHGATVISNVKHGKKGNGICFHAGIGVGTVTKKGLPLEVGEAAINPVPRQLMTSVIEALCKHHKIAPDFDVTISIPTGEKLAKRTWNPRLGIEGGLSILGTTGVVHPFSCSAWIHSIHRGIDVSRAVGVTHVLGATGSTSEAAANKIYNFPHEAMLDMGDFVGGLLKYLRNNPIDRITLAGGFAKFTKLAQGAMDLHSGRSQVDFNWLAQKAGTNMNQNMNKLIQNANTALEVLEITKPLNINLPQIVAEEAKLKALEILKGAPVSVEVLVFSRSGELLARTDWQ